MAPALHVVGGIDARDLAFHEAADELLEGHPVAVVERSALGLAVIADHDEVVAPRRVLGGSREAAHHAIDAVELLHGLGTLGTGMVGDLVVAEVVGVDDRRAPAHLADDEVGEHVAHDRRGRGLQEGKGPAPADARLDVADALASRLEVAP